MNTLLNSGNWSDPSAWSSGYSPNSTFDDVDLAGNSCYLDEDANDNTPSLTDSVGGGGLYPLSGVQIGIPLLLAVAPGSTLIYGSDGGVIYLNGAVSLVTSGGATGINCYNNGIDASSGSLSVTSTSGSVGLLLDGGATANFEGPTIFAADSTSSAMEMEGLVNFTGSGELFFTGVSSGVVPAAADVRAGTAVGSSTGTLAVPSPTDVLTGISTDNTTGTLTLPAAGSVANGVTYGVGGTGSTGTAVLTAAAVAAAILVTPANLLATDASGRVDLVNAPNATAIAAIQNGLSKPGIAQTITPADSSGVTMLLARIPGTVAAQTGDSYARLGAPAGASVSADIAAVKTEATTAAGSAATAATQSTTAATQSTTAATQATTAASSAATAATQATTAASNTASLPSMISAGAFTAPALANAPSGGGGGGNITQINGVAFSGASVPAVVTIVPDADQCVGTLSPVQDGQGNTLANTDVEFQLVASSQSGAALRRSIYLNSGGSGEIVQPFKQGSTYQYRIDGGAWVSFATSADSTPFVIPQAFGRPTP